MDKASVYTIGDLECIMRGLELANPGLAQAFDVLRVSLGIEGNEPRAVWSVSQGRERIEMMGE